MKILLLTTALATVTASAFAADVGVSVRIGEPGFYGRLDIGDYPPPQLIYQRPYIVERVPENRPPIYLHVPPGHAKHWSKNCHKYNACGERVFFVQDSWYNREYVPRYQERQGGRNDGRKEERKDERKDGDRGGKDNKQRGRD